MLHFSIVDVFAVEQYTGNQLAVFRNAAHLSDAQMQAIAREMHFSETTFILSDKPRNSGYDVRIFTPSEEVPFAGHPTLGTAYVIHKQILQRPVEQVILNLKVGQIPVTYADESADVLWMRQNAPEFGKTLDAARLARILNLSPDDIDARFPVQEVSTGLPHILVPLKNIGALRQARVAREEYFALIQHAWAQPILVFCPGGYNGCDLGVRMFADCFGITEDPATGSGNGCLAGYLVKHRYFGTPTIQIRTGQGFEIQRPSHLFLQAEERGDAIDVRVGGRVIPVAEGTLV
ncbi:phenazine biosynthesis protein PhzF family [Candidatus Moduliflexus flocculans]|uniref:Phenazine biosynthesis protein PhzF family n=1 Tax=Candidatus Moduliflexus flocculans TaxID=1499966 RepID=A0A081BLU9_9BACT|nr:phenazine biosynthesis protein PhzF family [Candidatus Moduliflexus flocculans]